MGLFKKKEKDYDFRFNGIVVSTEGLPQIPVREQFNVSLAGDIITVKNINLTFNLKKEQVTAVGIYGERETISKGKSVVGRGIVGAVVAGPVGAVVGGLSGTKDKQQTVQHFYWYICFTSSSGQPCRLDMETFLCSFEVDKFNKAVRPQNAGPVQL